MSRTRMRTRITTNDRPRQSAVDESPSLLRLLHLASPALPIGAFHFSQGLEFAVDTGRVHDEESALAWIDGIGAAGLATLDLPVLHRLHSAWMANDDAGVLRWNAFLIACRETAELRLEDRHLGAALLRVLAEFGITSKLLVTSPAEASVGVAHATSFSLACARWNLTSVATLQSFAWAWAENLVLAAVKLVPLGQSAGQRMLCALQARLGAHSARAAEIPDAEIGVATSLQAVASARHETQYTRLFRS
jgi:urease accessory protein